MSTGPVSDPEILLDARGMPIETWGGKFTRKFKENPFVPVCESRSLPPPRARSPGPCPTQWPG